MKNIMGLILIGLPILVIEALMIKEDIYAFFLVNTGLAAVCVCAHIGKKFMED